MSSSSDGSLLDNARQLATAGAWTELVALLDDAARSAEGEGELTVLYGEGLMRVRRERDAYRTLRGAEPKLSRAKDRALHRRAINLIGVAAFRLGELAEADVAFGHALELADEANDALLVARVSNNMGNIANLQGRHVRALSHFRTALPMYQRLGQQQGLAESYHNMAVTFRDLGELEEADQHEQRAIEFAGEASLPRLAAMGRIGRAEIALRRGDAVLAGATARRAAREFARLDDPLNEADATRLLGCALCRSGEFSEAGGAFADALAIARDRGYALVEGETLRDRVGLWELLERFTDALADGDAALAIFTRLHAVAERDVLALRLAALRAR